MVKCCNGKEGRVGEQKIREIGKQGSIAFRQALALWNPSTTPSDAAANVARYRHCRRPPPFMPPALAATADAYGRWCCRSMPLPPSTASSVDCLHRRRRSLPPPLPTIVSNR